LPVARGVPLAGVIVVRISHSPSRLDMSENQEVAADADAAPPKRAPKGMILIGTLVGGLLAGTAAGLFAVGPMVARSSGYAVVSDSTAKDSAGGHGEEGATGATEVPSVYLIDNMVLNPAGSGGTRFLMLATAVEFSDAKYVEMLRVRDVEARDVLLRVVGARTVEELGETSFRERLRKELADSLSILFAKADRPTAIKRVLFPQFVIQ
jgi:flagellar protein FliL